MKILFLKLRQYLKVILSFLCNYKVKYIIILFTIFYCIVLIILFYFYIKKYLEVLQFLNTHKLSTVSKDISQLLSLHPLYTNQIVINPDIPSIYYINGITHYSEFIYPNTSDLNSLHTILK